MILRDRRLRQGSFNWPELQGLTGSFVEFWRRSVIGQEGEAHKALRNIAVPSLAPEYVDTLSPTFENIAASLIAGFQGQSDIELMREFALPFAGQAICTLMGKDRGEWAVMAQDAADLGLAMGVDCKPHQARINAAHDCLAVMADDLIEQARIGSLSPSYLTRLVANFDRSAVTDENALRDLVVISIFGGVDTTKSQLGFVVALLAEHQEQWEQLRNEPSLIANAIDESIRFRPTTTWATRAATESFVFGDQLIKDGETVHVLVHSSGTDPAIFDGGGFDVTARRKAHFGFGGGAHHCIGHFVAKTDMSAALRVLVKAWSTVSLAGTPKFLPDAGNTSPVVLPLRLEWA